MKWSSQEGTGQFSFRIWRTKVAGPVPFIQRQIEGEGGHNRSIMKKSMDSALALRVPLAGPDGCGSPRYDVCLSFPVGSDASPDPSFLRRLRASLATEGVSVCGPDASQAVCSSPQLPDASIRRSKICIPILSQGYASSKRCLRELVQVMDGKRSAGQMMLPIFDRVEPSDMRYQKRSFQRAILLFDGEEIERVKTELFEASHIHGWRMTDWYQPHHHTTLILSLS